ncbi:MAG: hypothetical protein AB1942_04820 [Pseudomonadota bacterium]
MRVLFLSAAALLTTATAALAAPASVQVTVAPELQKTFDKTYGVRESAQLTTDLRESVERSLAKSTAYEGARIELVLTDAKPNRPTFKQLSDTPGLSMESFGVGGASVEGRIIAADGAVTPVAYKWYETDLRQAYGNWVWSDATWTFDRFARKLARGEELARR